MTDDQNSTNQAAMQESRVVELTELLNDRYATAYKLREKGETYKSIGQALGVGATRARGMVIKAERTIRNARKIKAAWYYGLSERTKNCLLVEGFNSREEIEQLIQRNGRLPKIANMGKKSREEVYCWIKIDNPEGKSDQASERTIMRAITFLEKCGYKVTKSI